MLLNDKNNTILTNKFINQYINNFSNKFINTFIINDLNIIKDILDDINEEDNINLNVYNKYIGYEFNKNIYTNNNYINKEEQNKIDILYFKVFKRI